jgi:DegV family protein with EDD domain
MSVRIVTDSTSDIPADLAEQLGITVVPLKVRFGNQEFRDGVDLTSEEFYTRLTGSPEFPTTSQPSVAEFIDVYDKIGRNSEGIVSIHISSKLSGTYNSAIQAKEQRILDCPLEVIDTMQASMGLGMVAISAARKAGAGAGFDDIVSHVKAVSGKCQCIVLVDTLEYLEKGGRIGKARALIGSLLRIKPLIIVKDGIVHELAKERTRSRAIARLQSEVREYAPVEELAVLYSTSRDEAVSLAHEITDLLPDGKEPFITRFGPVIGTYLGPGGLGVGLLRR